MRTRTRSGTWDRHYALMSSVTEVGHAQGTPLMSHDRKVWLAPYSDLAMHLQSHMVGYTHPLAGTTATSEEITDPGGARKFLPNGASVWNFCSHTKRAAKNIPISWVERLNPVTGNITHYACAEKPSPVLLAATTVPPALSAYDKAVRYGECYEELRPHLESEVSLANTIYELKDFKGFVKYFHKGVDGIAAAADDIKQTFRSSKKTLVKEWDGHKGRYVHTWDFINPAVQLDLSIHYALKPMVADIYNMMEAWKAYTQVIDKYNRQGAVRNVRHARRPFGGLTGTTGTSRFVTHTYSGGVYSLTGEMTYRLKKMSQMEFLLKYSGIAVTPATVWNMIPFSFLLDYVTNAAEIMASLNVGDTDMDMTRLIESVKSETSNITCLRDTWSQSGGSQMTVTWKSSPGLSLPEDVKAHLGGGTPVAYSTVKTYVRSPISVPYIRPPILPRIKFPNAKQVRLGLDLIYSIFVRGNDNPMYRRG